MPCFVDFPKTSGSLLLGAWCCTRESHLVGLFIKKDSGGLAKFTGGNIYSLAFQAVAISYLHVTALCLFIMMDSFNYSWKQWSYIRCYLFQYNIGLWEISNIFCRGNYCRDFSSRFRCVLDAVYHHIDVNVQISKPRNGHWRQKFSYYQHNRVPTCSGTISTDLK